LAARRSNNTTPGPEAKFSHHTSVNAQVLEQCIKDCKSLVREIAERLLALQAEAAKARGEDTSPECHPDGDGDGDEDEESEAKALTGHKSAEEQLTDKICAIEKNVHSLLQAHRVAVSKVRAYADATKAQERSLGESEREFQALSAACAAALFPCSTVTRRFSRRRTA
jgi:hypothetical protein